MEKKQLEQPLDEMVATQEIAPVQKHPLYSRIKGMRPDKEFADDDEMLSEADGILNEHDEYRKRNDEANKTIIEALYAEPVMANVLEAIAKGADMMEALAMYISPEDMEKALAESNPDTWADKKAQRESNIAANKAFMDEVNANTAESQNVITKWSENRGLDPEATTAFINDVSAALADVYKGKITENFLDSMYEAKTKAADMEEVAQAAEIKGRNANIEDLTAKETGIKGDGLPGITSVGIVAAGEPKKAPQKHELENIVEGFNKRNTI